MPAISIPTTAALSPTQRVSVTDPSVSKLLNRISRSSLISLALDWLDDRNQDLSQPYLSNDSNDEDDDHIQVYSAAESLSELRDFYTHLQSQKGSKREVVDRILEGDWRHGLSLYQLAMADLQHLYDHPTSLKWTAMKVVRRSNSHQAGEAELSCIPRFHPPTFLQNLQNEVLPDVKAYYHLDTHPTLPITILRISFFSSPYNTSLTLIGSHAADASRTALVAFPAASPHVFISTSQVNINKGSSKRAETMNVRAFLQNAIPRAFSKPRERCVLESTALSVKTLESLLDKRGSARGNAAKAGWSIYVDGGIKDDQKTVDTPLEQIPTTVRASMVANPPKREDITSHGRKRKLGDSDAAVHAHRLGIAEKRFAASARPDDSGAIERLDIRLRDAFPIMTAQAATPRSPILEDSVFGNENGDNVSSLMPRRRGRRSALEVELEEVNASSVVANEQDQEWVPDIRITFTGSHVFSGLRELVECGAIDGQKMPGWMTGEEGVSLGVVREGRIVEFKGSGV